MARSGGRIRVRERVGPDPGVEGRPEVGQKALFAGVGELRVAGLRRLDAGRHDARVVDQLLLLVRFASSACARTRDEVAYSRTFVVEASASPRARARPSHGLPEAESRRTPKNVIANREPESPNRETNPTVLLSDPGGTRRAPAGAALRPVQPTVTHVRAATPATITTTPASCSRVKRSRRSR